MFDLLISEDQISSNMNMNMNMNMIQFDGIQSHWKDLFKAFYNALFDKVFAIALKFANVLKQSKIMFFNCSNTLSFSEYYSKAIGNCI